ncbi:MAG: outer membrane beta-barrel domain-containing protein [Desulfobacteraceae bacterium]|nr:MAG: outer membrane beta-barrel domain-containing protein [Desulfobacteraceae bacterium]
MKKKTIRGALLIAVFLYLAQVGWCETRQGDFYFSPMFGGHLFEGNQNIDNAATYVLGLGYQFTDQFGAEAMFNFTKTDSDPGSSDIDVYPMHLDAVYNIFPDQKCVPYVAAGLGAISFDPHGDCSDTEFMMNYGAGIKYFIYEDLIALRGDVRHLISFDHTQSNLLYTAGLMFNFGCDKPAPAPAPVETVVAPPKLDSDKDGVYDCDDACPDTPIGVSVDAKGCPLDTDGDGVADYKDECPNTPKGAHVDARGCWVVEGVLFDTDKVDIKSQYVQELDNVATVMNNNPGLKFEIQGHTDNVGSPAYNQKLSEKRAWAVKNYLLKKGINKDRLTSKGFGFNSPAATNNTAEGKALNRRVEIKPLF